ncbi:hypothetical protein NDU88_002739 [Pleurodeles waltl]|uniref:Chromo domain-containing protein n=1 Tax=Pleurodeles waltl TaxID=8319 RepID=A0AAV7LEM6_PLEWA|nr:hypothetical protein NDU88_002739 [Pleurodeles waltl]
MPGLSRLANLFCLGCKRDSRLEDSCPVPPIGTPTYELYVKHGVGPITYNEVWIRYTRKDGVLKWPQNGSFDTEILDNLEVRLFKKKARPAMLDYFRLWRKEAKQKEIKLAKKNKREKVTATDERRMSWPYSLSTQKVAKLDSDRQRMVSYLLHQTALDITKPKFQCKRAKEKDSCC